MTLSEAQVAANRQKSLKVAADRAGCSVEEYVARRDSGEQWCTGHQQWHPTSEFAKYLDRGVRRFRTECRVWRSEGRQAHKRAARELVEAAAEQATVERMRAGWWPAPVEPDSDEVTVRGRRWPDVLAVSLVGQLWLFAADKACVGVDPELFFDEGRTVEAKRVCWGCPVADGCLTAALQRDERYGVFGAMTVEERDQVAGRSKPEWLVAS